MAKANTIYGFAKATLTSKQKLLLLSGACVFALTVTQDAEAARRKLIPERPSVEIYLEAIDNLRLSPQDMSRGSGMKWQTGAPAIVKDSATKTVVIPPLAPEPAKPAVVVMPPLAPEPSKPAAVVMPPVAPEPTKPAVVVMPPAPINSPQQTVVISDEPVALPNRTVTPDAEVTPQSSGGFNNLSINTPRVAPKTTIEASAPQTNTSSVQPMENPFTAPKVTTTQDMKATRRPINIEVPDTTDAANPAPSRFTAAVTGEAELVPGPPPVRQPVAEPTPILPTNNTDSAAAAIKPTANNTAAKPNPSAPPSPLNPIAPEPEARMDINKDMPDMPDVPERVGASELVHSTVVTPKAIPFGMTNEKATPKAEPEKNAVPAKAAKKASVTTDKEEKEIDKPVVAKKEKKTVSLKELEETRKAVTKESPAPAQSSIPVPPAPQPAPEDAFKAGEPAAPVPPAPLPNAAAKPALPNDDEDLPALPASKAPAAPVPPAPLPNAAAKSALPNDDEDLPALPASKAPAAPVPPAPLPNAAAKPALPNDDEDLPALPASKAPAAPVPPAPLPNAASDDEDSVPVLPPASASQAPKPPVPAPADDEDTVPARSQPAKDDGWFAGIKATVGELVGSDSKAPVKHPVVDDEESVAPAAPKPAISGLPPMAAPAATPPALNAATKPALSDEDVPPPPVGKPAPAAPAPLPNAAAKPALPNEDDELPPLPVGKNAAAKLTPPAAPAAATEEDDALPSLPLPPAKAGAEPVVTTADKLPPLPNAAKPALSDEGEELPPLPGAKSALPSPALLKAESAKPNDNRALDIARRHTSAPLPNTPVAATDDEDAPALPPLPANANQKVIKIDDAIKANQKPTAAADDEDALPAKSAAAPFGMAQPVAKGPVKPVPAPSIGAVDDEDLPPLPALAQNNAAKPAALPAATPPQPKAASEDEDAAPAAKAEPAKAASAPAGNVAQSVAFNAQDTALTSEQEASLSAVAKEAASSKKKISIMAFAAGTPDQASLARRVSLARALSVRAYLIDQGVDALNINVQAKGNATNADRVDIVTK